MDYNPLSKKKQIHRSIIMPFHDMHVATSELGSRMSPPQNSELGCCHFGTRNSELGTREPRRRFIRRRSDIALTLKGVSS
jgi:hypothetical protein